MNKHRINSLLSSSYTIILFLSVVVFMLLFLSSRFSSLFGSGIYRLTAFVFMAASICAVIIDGTKPKIAFEIALLILPLGARLSSSFLLPLGNMNLPVDVLMIWILWFIMVIYQPLVKDTIYILFVAFLLSLTISYCLNPSVFSLEILVFGVVTQFMVYQIARQNFHGLSDANRLIKILVIILMVCSLFAFIQPFIDKDFVSLFMVRIPSIFYNPIIFANVIVLLWPYCLVVKLPKKISPKLSLFYRSIMIAMSLMALLLTGSRGALIIIAMQSLVPIFCVKKMEVKMAKVTRSITVFITIAIVGMFCISGDYIMSTVLRRFTQIDFNTKGTSSSERMLGLLGGLEIGSSHPIFGVGLGNFRYAYPNTKVSLNGVDYLESAHNFIINLFAEGGFFAVIIWMLMVTLIAKRISNSRAFLRDKNEYLLYLTFLISFWGYVIVTFAFYGEFFHKYSGLPMILYSVVIAVISIVSKASANEKILLRIKN